MPNSPSEPIARNAVRLIFEYEGDQVRLVSQQPLATAKPVHDFALSDTPGYFVDTRDLAGQTLARIPAPNAFASDMEVFPEDHSEPIVRVPVEQPRGAFTVVIDAPQQATHVSVVRVEPAAGKEAFGPAGMMTTDLATFALSSNAGQGGQQ